MGLYYLTNFRDKDIRRSTYKILCETIAIFCAVLAFSSVHDMVVLLLGDSDLSNPIVFITQVVLFLFWYVLLQFSLAVLSGVLPWYVDTSGFDGLSTMEKHIFMEKMEGNMRCIALFLAHIAGFASINLWSGMQQFKFKYGDEEKHSLAFTYAITPIGIIAQFSLQRITNAVRYRITWADDEETIFEKEWNKQTSAAEDDIMALTVSFTFIQSVRFHLSNTLPNKEGEYEPQTLIDEFDGGSRAWFLMGVGMFWIFVAFLFLVFTHEEDEEEKDSIDEMLSDASPSSPKVRHGCWARIKGTFLDAWEDIKERGQEIMVLTAGMGFAWGVFFSTRWFVANLKFVVLSSKTTPDMEMVAIITALALSFGSFVAVFLLDCVYDRVGEESAVGRAANKTIETIGVLIGFAWEQCFDNSIHSISVASGSPHVVKFILAFLSVGLVAPAWKLYLLPMAYQEGWNFGFCPTEKKLEDAKAFYVAKHSNADRFNLQKGKKSHHGSEHQHASSEQSEEQGSPFLLMPEEDGAAVLDENAKLKAQIQMVVAKTEALSEYCEEHVDNMTSTIAEMLRPLSELET